MKFIKIEITCSDKEALEKIAHSMISKSLAACCQISGPIQSIYEWKGTVESQEEYLLAIKTKGHHFEKIEKEVFEMHPYESPEIIAFSIAKGEKKYLEWLDNQCGT